jgi:hypothetical protein
MNINKIVLAIASTVLIAIPAFSAQTDFTLKAGLNAASNMHAKVSIPDYDYSETADESIDDMGFFVGAEYTMLKQPQYSLGVDVRYLFEREDTSIIPVSLIGKMKFSKEISGTATLGYNFLSVKDLPSEMKINNGFCYSVGVEGQVMPDVKLFADYAIYNGGVDGEMSGTEVKTEMSMSTLTLGVAYNL